MRRVFVLSVLCFLVSGVNAGTWTVVNNNDLAVDLDNSFGSLFKASNLGSGQTAVTVDGIAFDTDLSNVTGAAGNWTSYSGTDPDLQNLLNSSMLVSQWGGGVEITLSGLTVGRDYQVQLVLVGEWAGSSANLYVNGVDYKYVYFGDAVTEKIATYIFTAANTSATVQCWKNQGKYHPSAYAVHEVVPEPATMFLLGLGSLIGLKRRK